MTRYEGYRTNAGAIVTVDGKALNPRWDLRNHSPTGFEWGYGGSGPAQLALAILVHHLGEDEKSLELYQPFKSAVIAKLPKHAWTLTTDQIREAPESLPRD